MGGLENSNYRVIFRSEIKKLFIESCFRYHSPRRDKRARILNLENLMIFPILNAAKKHANAAIVSQKPVIWNEINPFFLEP